MTKFKLKFGWMLTEDGYLINLIKGETYKLNATGREILSLILNNKSETEVCEIISRMYNVSLDIIMEDFESFITKLIDLGAIEVIENEK